MISVLLHLRMSAYAYTYAFICASEPAYMVSNMEKKDPQDRQGSFQSDNILKLNGIEITLL